MKFNSCLLLIWLSVNLLSCYSNDSFNAALQAKKYCDCIKRERKLGNSFLESRTKCDGRMISSNRYFRIDYIEDVYGRYMKDLDRKTADSVSEFATKFYHYIERNCCKEAIRGCDSSFPATSPNRQR